MSTRSTNDSKNSREHFLQSRYLRGQSQTGASLLLRKKQFTRLKQEFVQTKEFNRLQDRAYRNVCGVSFGVVEGQRVMFVCGSRNIIDWFFNFIDAYIIHDKLEVVSNYTAYKLTRQYRRDMPDIVVGHSRGAALVGKMDVPMHRKMGVDGAMIITPKHSKEMINLHQDILLDNVIAMTGKNNKSFQLHNWRNYHFLSRDFETNDSTSQNDSENANFDGSIPVSDITMSDDNENDSRLDESHQKKKTLFPIWNWKWNCG